MQNDTAAPQPAGEKISTSRNCDGFIWALQVNTEIVGMPRSLAPSMTLFDNFSSHLVWTFFFMMYWDPLNHYILIDVTLTPSGIQR